MMHKIPRRTLSTILNNEAGIVEVGRVPFLCCICLGQTLQMKPSQTSSDVAAFVRPWFFENPDKCNGVGVPKVWSKLSELWDAIARSTCSKFMSVDTGAPTTADFGN